MTGTTYSGGYWVTCDNTGRVTRQIRFWTAAESSLATCSVSGSGDNVTAATPSFIPCEFTAPFDLSTLNSTDIFMTSSTITNTGGGNCYMHKSTSNGTPGYFRGVTSGDESGSELSFALYDADGPVPDPPVISNIDVTTYSTSALITWDTDTDASGEVFWGLTSTYDHNNSVDDGTLTAHEVTISSGMGAGTTYHYQVCSTDDYDQETCSDDDTFTTTGTGTPTGPIVGNVLVVNTVPMSNVYIKTSVLNATSSCPPGDPPQDGTCLMYFQAETNIPATAETIADTDAISYSVYADGPVLCTGTSSANGPVMNHHMSGYFSPIFWGCPDFADGTRYTIASKARYGGTTYGSPAFLTTFEAVADDFDPPPDYISQGDYYWSNDGVSFIDGTEPECTIFAFSFASDSSGGSEGDGFSCFMDWIA